MDWCEVATVNVRPVRSQHVRLEPRRSCPIRWQAEYNEREMEKPYDDARAKLMGDSADRDWYDLWPRVTSARADLLQALEGVTDETAARRPGEGEGEAAWSIAEVVRHVLM